MGDGLNDQLADQRFLLFTGARALGHGEAIGGEGGRRTNRNNGAVVAPFEAVGGDGGSATYAHNGAEARGEATGREKGLRGESLGDLRGGELRWLEAESLNEGGGGVVVMGGENGA